MNEKALKKNKKALKHIDILIYTENTLNFCNKFKI
jgi:hypothetical protein